MLTKNINDSVFSYWQVAENGIWEDAITIPPSPSSDALNHLLSWHEEAGPDIAIEAFFGDNHSNNFMFFGGRVKALEKTQQKEFIISLIQQAQPGNSFHDFYAHYCNILNTYWPSHSFSIDQKPDFLELGAEGFWKSYGSYVIWEAGEKSPKTLKDIEEHAPHLLSPFKRAIMMEHAWNNPMPCWLALPVSVKQENSFIFDRERYQELIKSAVSTRD